MDIFATISNAGVPVNGLTDPPEIRIRDGANVVVQAFTAMTDMGADGKHTFAFVIPDTAESYTFIVDADPLVSGQVPADDRYYQGSFPGEADIVATTPDLANLDVAVSTRATQASVDAIQNNTRFAGIVPATLVLPVTGTEQYRFFGRLFDTAGSPEDPDANTMNLRIEDSAGAVVVATTPMTRTGVGLYQFDYVVNATDTERQLNVFFEYAEAAVAFQHIRTTIVQEFETSLAIIQQAVVTDIPAQISGLNDLSIIDVQTALTSQGYTTARALLLDNLDGSISSVLTAIGNLNDISVGDILSAVLASGNTVDDELSGILALRDFIEGGRDIDFAGNDALGWQRIERDTAGAILRRYNLFDENAARINETVASFIGRQGMISSEVAI